MGMTSGAGRRSGYLWRRIASLPVVLAILVPAGCSVVERPASHRLREGIARIRAAGEPLTFEELRAGQSAGGGLSDQRAPDAARVRNRAGAHRLLGQAGRVGAGFRGPARCPGCRNPVRSVAGRLGRGAETGRSALPPETDDRGRARVGDESTGREPWPRLAGWRAAVRERQTPALLGAQATTPSSERLC